MKIVKLLLKYKYIFMIVGIAISISLVSAAIVVSSSDVSISSSSTTKTNLFDAIEELYGLSSENSCPYGQTCIRCEAGSFADQENNVCTTCVAGTYSEGGVNSCLTCPDGYTSDASAIARTECYIETTAGKFIEIANTSIQLDCPEGSYCPSTKINYGSSGAINECPSGYTSDSGATQISDCYIQTTAGKYIATANDNNQTDCPAGSYCPSTKVSYGSTGGISACPSGYGNSAAGSTEASNCYLSTSSGKYVATANQGETSCSAGGYCSGGTTVYYGSTGGRTGCPSGYGSSAAGSTTANNCYLSTSSGKYVATANQGETACTSGGYCSGGTTVYYGSTGGRTGCPSGYGSSASSSTAASNCYLSTTAGKFVATANQGQTACTSGGYCPGGTTVYYGSTGGRTGCPSGYGSSASSSTAASNCYLSTTAGKFVATANQGQTACTSGGYCPGGTTVYYGNTGGRSGCPSGYGNSAASSTAASNCYLSTASGKYVATANQGQTACTSGGYCPGGTTVYYGSTGGRSGCPSGYGNSAASSTAATQCYMTTTAGYYVATSGGGQTLCTAGNYCPSATVYYGNTGSINACGSNTTSSAGASSSSDCLAYVTCPKVGAAQYTSDGNVTSTSQCYVITNPGTCVSNFNYYKGNLVTCGPGNYCPGGVKIYYGSEGGYYQCPAGYRENATSPSSINDCAYYTTRDTTSNGNLYRATYTCTYGSSTCSMDGCVFFKYGNPSTEIGCWENTSISGYNLTCKTNVYACQNHGLSATIYK